MRVDGGGKYVIKSLMIRNVSIVDMSYNYAVAIKFPTIISERNISQN
jgi:hypothetical protein